MGATFKSITELEAAERQLAQAIRLFFGQGDEIAIHTPGVSRLPDPLRYVCGNVDACAIEDSAILEEMGVEKRVLTAMRKPQSFFKHADRDSDEQCVSVRCCLFASWSTAFPFTIR